jgi:hypothetical protein
VPHIDSLAIGGRIKDAYTIEAELVSVMLYVNDSYKDSIYNLMIYHKYIDSLKPVWNLKAGKYLLVALKDKTTIISLKE